MRSHFKNLRDFGQRPGIGFPRWILAGGDVTSLKRNIAANLTKCLAELKKTQREFAKYVGVGESTASAWLAGEKLPRDEHWPKITQFVRRPIEEITRDPGVPETDQEAVLRFLRNQLDALGYNVVKRN